MRVAPGLATASLSLALARTVSGSLYVISPREHSKCHGGVPCLVSWLDDGQAPLVTAMGPCSVALFAGNEIVIQRIEPLDVSVEHSFTFTPNPSAGQNSDNYYIAFTSIRSPDLSAFSPFFSLDQMIGTFGSPVAELTSTIPVPPSVLSAQPNTVSTTSILSGAITAPTVSTLPPSSSTSSGPSSPSSTSSSIAATSPSNAATRQSLRLWAIITLAGLSISFLL